MKFVPLVPPVTPGPAYGRDGFDPHPGLGAFILSIAVVLMGWNILPLLQKGEAGFSTGVIHWIKIGIGWFFWLVGMAFLARARYMSWASGIGYGLLFLPGLILLLWHARHNTRHSAWDTPEELNHRFRPMRCVDKSPLLSGGLATEKVDYSEEWARIMESNLPQPEPNGPFVRHYSPEQILWLLRQHLEEGRPVSTICHEHEIDEKEFLEWKKSFFEKGGAAIERRALPRRRDVYNEKLAQLEARLRQKDEVIAALTAELMRTKQEFLER